MAAIDPNFFQVNFPLSQAPGLFCMLSPAPPPQQICIENFGTLVLPQQITAFPPELFNDDLLAPSLFDSGHANDVASEIPDQDSDVEKEFMNEKGPSGSRTSSPVHMDLKVKEIGIKPPQPKMEKFPVDKVSDFKHVIYNLLVDHYNDPSSTPFVEPVTLVLDGEVRTGFRFPDAYNPDKKLPELYAQHIRRARLDMENQDSIFIQDLYKFYLRACLELLAKYFEKCDKYTFLDDGVPLFVAGTSLKEAEVRMKTMRTRARKRKSAAKEAKKPKRGKANKYFDDE